MTVVLADYIEALAGKEVQGWCPYFECSWGPGETPEHRAMLLDKSSLNVVHKHLLLDAQEDTAPVNGRNTVVRNPLVPDLKIMFGTVL